jgi:hypothetical protein
MKTIWIAACFLTLTAMGCVTSHEASVKGTIWKGRDEPPPGPVTPAQVTPENADKMSDALWDEMDRQAQDELLKENAAKAVPAKK